MQTALGREQGGKGTGLGLSLARSITSLSGGRLGVKSKYGEGSTFWVEFPFFVSLFTFPWRQTLTLDRSKVGPQTRDWNSSDSHRRVSSNSCLGQTFPPTRKHSSSFGSSIGSMATPSSTYSDVMSEYSFGKPWSTGLWSPGKPTADGLPKIDESHGAIEMLSLSAASTINSTPTMAHSPLSFYGSTLRSPPLLSPPTPTAPPSTPEIAATSTMAPSPSAFPSPPTLPRVTSTASNSTVTSNNASKSIGFEHGPVSSLASLSLSAR